MDNDTPLVQFENVSFAYVNPDRADSADSEDNAANAGAGGADSTEGAGGGGITAHDLSVVFREVDLDIPPGVLSVIGGNGIGKSTLMLLASARLFPVDGTVRICGRDSARWREAAGNGDIERERNELVSVVYQNMEFESTDSVARLIENVFLRGLHDDRDDWILKECREVLELEGFMDRRFQQLSKGEMQRVLVALALAYGSALTVMDEPVFAMEEYQKERTLEYVRHYSHKTRRSAFFSAHNINLCRKYADNTLLLRKDGNFVLGNPQEVCSRDELEAAYKAPMDVLYRREHLYREMLVKRSQ